MRRSLVSILASLSLLSVQAQHAVGEMEMELSTGFATPLGGYRGGENRTTMSWGVEFRYNFPSSAWDVGALVDITTAGRKFSDVVVDNLYNPEKVYKQDNRTTAIALTTYYNLARGNNVSAFIGTGIGVAFNKTHGSVAYPSKTTSLAVIPRFGFEFFNRIRISCQAHISRTGYNALSVNLGYTIGGRRK